MPKPMGRVTRGTTSVNRLRRVDRWIGALPALRLADDPLVVDLGYGASATTSIELWERLATVRSDVEVVGIEIDPERVRLASEQLAARRRRLDPDGQRTERVAIPAREGNATADPTRPVRVDRGAPSVSFRLGGFEVPLEDGRRPVIIRAMNVLRQYDESEVAPAWRQMLTRLQSGGALVEGTCSENGRIGSWVTLSPERGPQTLTLGLHLPSIGAPALETPGVVAERLPKALIHRNVPGEPIHAFLRDLDRAWAAAASLSVYGPTQRWIATAATLRERWPIARARSRWRLGELTVDWTAIAPHA